MFLAIFLLPWLFNVILLAIPTMTSSEFGFMIQQQPLSFIIFAITTYLSVLIAAKNINKKEFSRRFVVIASVTILTIGLLAKMIIAGYSILAIFGLDFIFFDAVKVGIQSGWIRALITFLVFGAASYIHLVGIRKKQP